MDNNTTVTRTAFSLTHEEMVNMSRSELIENMEQMQELGDISYKVIFLATSLISMAREAHMNKGGIADKLLSSLFESPECPKTREEWEEKFLDEIFESEKKVRILAAIEEIMNDIKEKVNDKE